MIIKYENQYVMHTNIEERAEKPYIINNYK